MNLAWMSRLGIVWVRCSCRMCRTDVVTVGNVMQLSETPYGLVLLKTTTHSQAGVFLIHYFGGPVQQYSGGSEKGPNSAPKATAQRNLTAVVPPVKPDANAYSVR